MQYHFLIALLACLVSKAAQATSPVPEGFPATWNGDRYFKSLCDVAQAPPKWLDGYFFCQLSASYGERTSEEGQRVDHMFDAIGGLAVFDVSPEKTTYTGAYYPTRSYKIWNFYDRDFKKSSIAWTPGYAKVNESAIKMWEHIMPEQARLPPPNVGFWKIKDRITGVTEVYSVGLTFNIDTVDDFRPYPFKEATPIMSGQPLIPIHMPTHERMDTDTGLLWSTAFGVNVSSMPPTLHQVVFSVDEDGVRRVEGVHDYSQFKPWKCSEGRYSRDEGDSIPANMHSITSTKNYVIIPLTSVLFNPCILLKGPKAMPKFEEVFQFDEKAQVTFLVFDKRTKEFLPPIKLDEQAQFITHQFNAYEVSDNVLVADMLTYDDYAYDSLDANHLLKNPPGQQNVRRFTLDLEKKTINSKSLVPENHPLVEFPQFNHNYEGKRYKYGYVITDVYMAGNTIVKIDIDDPSGKNNKEFRPKNSDSIALLEPYFVQRPGTTEEDDGVIVSRGLDVSINKAKLYVLDAKTMEQVGEIVAPTDIPFGFHERFYLKDAFKYEDQKARVEL